MYEKININEPKLHTKSYKGYNLEVLCDFENDEIEGKVIDPNGVKIFECLTYISIERAFYELERIANENIKHIEKI